MKRLLAQLEYNLPKPQADAGTAEIILNFVFVILGVVSVLVIVIAGFQLVISGGNPDKVAKARQAILYAVVGVVVAISAFAIVNFVVSRA